MFVHINDLSIPFFSSFGKKGLYWPIIHVDLISISYRKYKILQETFSQFLHFGVTSCCWSRNLSKRRMFIEKGLLGLSGICIIMGIYFVDLELFSILKTSETSLNMPSASTCLCLWHSLESFMLKLDTCILV